MNPIGALQRYAIIALVVIIAGGLFGAWERHQGVKAGEAAGNARVAALQAEYAQATAAAKADADRREAAAAKATQAMHQQLAADLPKIEDTTHDRTESIRVIYRDHPVDVCLRPDGVLQRLDAARTAANAAATAAH